MFGVWMLELGTWSLELGAWNLELGTWSLELHRTSHQSRIIGFLPVGLNRTLPAPRSLPPCFLLVLSGRRGLNERGRLVQRNSGKDPARPCICPMLNLTYRKNDRRQNVSFGQHCSRRDLLPKPRIGHR